MIRIAIISELKKDREEISKTLSNQNDFKIIGLGNSEYDALKYAMDFQPDVEIMDLEKNDTTNLELASVIKRKSPSTALIVFSSHYKTDSASKALKAGVSGYVLKKIDMDRLVALVRIVFSGAYYISPPIVKEAFNFILAMEKFPSVRDYFLLAQEAYKTIPACISCMERQIMGFIGRGMTVREIAETLHLAPGTVRNYLSNATHKINIKGRVQVAIYAIKHGLIDMPEVNSKLLFTGSGNKPKIGLLQ
jgi:DNA-binding NarL/FixJ family response regulator